MIGRGAISILQSRISQSQVSSRANKVLGPVGQSLQCHSSPQISTMWSSTLVCGAQLSLQCSKIPTPYTLRVMYSTFLSLSINALRTLRSHQGIPGILILRYSTSTDVPVQVTDILNMFGMT